MLINDKGIFKHKYYSEVSLTEGLVAWYPLNGSAKDLVNMNDGTVYGATPAQGLNQLCYSFDGVDDYIRTPKPIIESTLTVSAWVYFNTSAVGEISNGDQWDGGPYTGWRLTTRYFKIGDGSSDTHSVTTSTNVSIKEWHHIVGTYNGLTLKLYQDSSLIRSKESYVNYINGSGWHYMSKYAGNGYYIDGLLQDVRIYNRALSDTEVELLYKTTGGSNTRMEVLQDKVYLTGILKEIE